MEIRDFLVCFASLFWIILGIKFSSEITYWNRRFDELYKELKDQIYNDMKEH